MNTDLHSSAVLQTDLKDASALQRGIPCEVKRGKQGADILQADLEIRRRFA
jgi:hypothetical protein